MVTIRQVKAARALLGWYQDDLAKAAGVSKPTVARLETDDGDLGGYPGTRDKIVSALEAAGVEFTNGGQPGVRMKRTSSGPDSIPRDELNASNDD